MYRTLNYQHATQLMFTCSQSTIEILEKYVKQGSKLPIKHLNDVNDFVLVFLLLTLNIFYTFF